MFNSTDDFYFYEFINKILIQFTKLERHMESNQEQLKNYHQ